MPSTNLYCSLQNRLGAMDRVLMDFTHRGIIPTQFYVFHNKDKSILELTIAFESSDKHALQKLIKSLQKQVYVLEVRLVGRDAGTKNSDLASPKYNGAERRYSDARYSEAAVSDAKYSDATMSIAAISA